MSRMFQSWRLQAIMLRSLPAILSIIILVLGPRTCCLVTFLSQSSSPETSSRPIEMVKERCCCNKQCTHSETEPRHSDEKNCPCEKRHGENPVIIQSTLLGSADQDNLSPSNSYVAICHAELAMFRLTNVCIEPVGFPRLFASSLLRLISVALC